MTRQPTVDIGIVHNGITWNGKSMVNKNGNPKRRSIIPLAFGERCYKLVLAPERDPERGTHEAHRSSL